MDRNKRNSLFGRKRSNIINGGFLGKNIFNNSIWQHYLEPWTANPNYWIADRFHDNAVCLLAAFAGTIHVRPANSTFHGGTFIVSPEESLGRRANCERNSPYIECLQTIDKELVNNNRFQMRDNDVCTNLSVSFDLGTFGNPQSYECNHIWSKTLRDVHYNQNKRRYAGEVQISLKWVRIDKDPLGVAPYSFRRARRKCVWDTIFGWQSLTIMGSLLIFFIIGFFGLCVCSNSSCHDDETGEWTNNWCCMLCCCFSCCRRRSSRFRSGSLNTQRIVQYEHTPNTTRLECNHHQHHRHHHHHHHHRGPPPPPPPPSSSTSLLTNTSSHPNHIGCGQRKPTFSNSYSYEGTGSNPTQQSSSSAMSTAIDDYYYYKMKNNNENASIHRYNKHDDLVVIAVTPTTTTNDDYNDDKWQILMKELPYQQQEKFSNTIGILGENENEIFQSKINQCDHHQQQWQNCSILMDNNLNSHHNDYKQMPLSIQLSKFNCNNNKNGDGDNNDDDHGYYYYYHHHHQQQQQQQSSSSSSSSINMNGQKSNKSIITAQWSTLYLFLIEFMTTIRCMMLNFLHHRSLLDRLSFIKLITTSAATTTAKTTTTTTTTMMMTSTKNSTTIKNSFHSIMATISATKLKHVSKFSSIMESNDNNDVAHFDSIRIRN
ncbi:hypothetical protein HUG17_0528 [Dermatophagoides farinae]|uniref:Uncharacterized protein n=1 Tax=Dermatophagoides farinae TaxID=6954 RepID=A0A9D4P8F8_DERFA|nr:hypothetical protein HUG17_0528 [Dermatophagoides farinae]